jgi:hypothetical protein
VLVVVVLDAGTNSSSCIVDSCGSQDQAIIKCGIITVSVNLPDSRRQ